MRDYFSPRPLPRLPRRGAAPPFGAALVAPARLPYLAPARPERARPAAVAVPPVAAPADQRQPLAATTAEQTRRRRGDPAAATASQQWTGAAFCAKHSRHACPSRCGARRWFDPPRCSPAPCLPHHAQRTASRRADPAHDDPRRHSLLPARTATAPSRRACRAPAARGGRNHADSDRRSQASTTSVNPWHSSYGIHGFYWCDAMRKPAAMAASCAQPQCMVLGPGGL